MGAAQEAQACLAFYRGLGRRESLRDLCRAVLAFLEKLDWSSSQVLTMIHSSLLDFKFMIRRITGKSALISYNAYGCHCGLGGRGQPLDKTDWCCHAHDCCYKELTNQSCHPFFDDYQYSIINEDVMCWNTTNSTCAKQACDCDRTAVLCFRKEASSYNKGYRYYFNFFCKGSTPSC
ncbi:group IIE secretory phospholipase A2-like isoform X2 [Chrysemys picta bellii]|uniref:group IIE secretory phospholipase A2-like isoform X2 n=1 Tax=Chrysemys picta bellii TaxID=8478 RepID=UPI0032B1C9C1